MKLLNKYSRIQIKTKVLTRSYFPCLFTAIQRALSADSEHVCGDLQLAPCTNVDVPAHNGPADTMHACAPPAVAT